MKKKIFILLLILVIASTAIFADSINQPAAVVRYTSTKVISMDDLDSSFANTQQALKLSNIKTTVTKSEVLDNMIDAILLEQGAKKEGIVINDENVTAIMEAQKQRAEQAMGKTISQQEFETLFTQESGMPYEKAIEELKKTQLIQGLIQKRFGAELQTKTFVPTEEEVNAFFKKNRASYVQPEMVGVSHIFIAKNTDPILDAQNKAKLKKIASDLKNHLITWDSAVLKYSEDENTKHSGGNLNFLRVDDSDIISIIGQDFFDTAFDLPTGETSNVVTSETGYHIIKNTGHYEAKLLGLDDQVYPNQTTTLREVIMNALSSDMQQKYMRELVDTLIEEIKAKSTVKILYKEGN